ncbi:MAG: DUF3298 domain-containing protein [Bacteroidales bacterium]|nr:DUF3298 domain-containing protein [Eubacteriales bacterium]MDD4669976.1 DUF3298 domain-containing protein [Bacteroidales bacterium]
MKKSLSFLGIVAVTSLLLCSCDKPQVQFKTLTCNEVFKSEKVIEKFHPAEDAVHGIGFNLHFTYPVSGVDEALIPVMQNALVESFFSGMYPGMEPEAAFDTFIQANRQDYLNEIDACIGDCDEMVGGLFSWKIYIVDTICFQNDRLIQFQTDGYGYTGGAHGTTWYTGVLFDLEQGRMLTSDDVFVSDAEPLKDLLIEEYLKTNEELRNSDDASNIAGIRNNTWNGQTHFAITDDGIYFMYDSYALGYYALGSPKLFLSYDRLKGLIREDSPVYDIANAVK